jgi:hypothetical protein
MESERRASPRYPFFAPAELTEVISRARTEARTGDLGSNGCYLEMINPPPGTVISNQIVYQGQIFTAGGVVAHSYPNTGMGVKFIALESGCSVSLGT